MMEKVQKSVWMMFIFGITKVQKKQDGICLLTVINIAALSDKVEMGQTLHHG